MFNGVSYSVLITFDVRCFNIIDPMHLTFIVIDNLHFPNGVRAKAYAVHLRYKRFSPDSRATKLQIRTKVLLQSLLKSH
jgi:hypothetical protein